MKDSPETIFHGAAEIAVTRHYAENKESLREVSVRLHMITFGREAIEAAHAKQLKKVAALRDEIASGRAFAEVARKHSQDAYAEDGGDRGVVERGQMKRELDRAIFTAQPGEPTVHGDYRSLWILMVEDRQEGEIPPLEEVREKIAQLLQEQERDELIQTWRREAKERLGPEPPQEQPTEPQPAIPSPAPEEVGQPAFSKEPAEAVEPIGIPDDDGFIPLVAPKVSESRDADEKIPGDDGFVPLSGSKDEESVRRAVTVTPRPLNLCAVVVALGRSQGRRGQQLANRLSCNLPSRFLI